MQSQNDGAATLAEPVMLPCGAKLPNRLAKAAMTEGLARGDNLANSRFVELYRRWGAGGAGLLITGNVAVDRWHLERGGNLAIDGPQTPGALDALSHLALAAKSGGAHVWMQLNHAGRQTRKAINPSPRAPSDIRLQMGLGRFAKPVGMAAVEINSAIDAFVHAARVAEICGFDGVQIQAGHGFLVSQFLSPLANRRADRWGGPLENRARFLLEIVRRTRDAVKSAFAVSVKLNASDFQRGGFCAHESAKVAKWVEEAGVDLIELSGGNYEQPRMLNFHRHDKMTARTKTHEGQGEGYFLEHVPEIRSSVSIPLMLTGGFRSAAAMRQAILRDGVDVIGLARPLVLDPLGARRILEGEVDRLASRDGDLAIGNGVLGPRSPIGFLRDLNFWGALGWYCEHIHCLADGHEPDMSLSPFRALLAFDRNEARAAGSLER